jgi:hypothetical protein
MTAIAGDAPVPWRRGPVRWLLVAVYFAAIASLHLQFSLWLTAERALPWGRGTLSDLVPAAAGVAATALAVIIGRQLQRAAHPWPLAAGWLLVLAAALAIDRWLTYSWNEAFHYPQYALLAILVARALDPGHRLRIAGRVLFWTTLAGGLDELLQYLWVTPTYSHYFDFNDVLMNLVAATAGVLLWIGAAPGAVRARARPPKTELAVAAGLVLIIAVAVAGGRLQLSPPLDLPPGGLHLDANGRVVLFLQRSRGQYGSWQPSVRRVSYYALPPRQGLAAVALAAALFTFVAGAAMRQPEAAATMPRSRSSKSV